MLQQICAFLLSCYSVPHNSTAEETLGQKFNNTQGDTIHFTLVGKERNLDYCLLGSAVPELIKNQAQQNNAGVFTANELVMVQLTNQKHYFGRVMKVRGCEIDIERRTIPIKIDKVWKLTDVRLPKNELNKGITLTTEDFVTYKTLPDNPIQFELKPRIRPSDLCYSAYIEKNDIVETSDDCAIAFNNPEYRSNAGCKRSDLTKLPYKILLPKVVHLSQVAGFYYTGFKDGQSCKIRLDGESIVGDKFTADVGGFAWDLTMCEVGFGAALYITQKERQQKIILKNPITIPFEAGELGDLVRKKKQMVDLIFNYR